MKNKLVNFAVLSAMLIAGMAFSPALRGEKKDFTFNSMYSFKSIGGLSLSPDGKRLLFSVRKRSAESNRSQSLVQITDLNGKNPVEITNNGRGIWNIQWIEGGKKLAFLSSAKNGVQVFTRDLQTGRIAQITDYKTGIVNYVWSPTNKGLAFVTRVYPENNAPDYYISRKAREKKIKHTGKLYSTLLYRPYSVWDDGTVTHVFYMDFESKKVIDVTPGKYNAPAKFLGSGGDIAFSSDGKTLAYTMNKDKVQALSTNNDVFTVRLDGSGCKKISTSKGNDTRPLYSEDGKYMAYLEMIQPQHEADQKDVILINLKTKKRINLTKDLDRTISSFFFAHKSKYMYFSCGDSGYNSLYKVKLPGGKMEKILGDIAFSSVNIDKKGKNIYLVKSDSDTPGDLYCYNVKKKKFSQLTSYGSELTDNYKMGTTESFWFKGAYGDSVQGFVTFPYGYDRNKKYPLVMLFHGGPEGAWKDSYSDYGGNVHLISGQGYVVVKMNPHGSNTYGLKFQDAIHQKWGRVDVEDVNKCLDYLFKKYPFIDSSRVAAMGRSYGGFLCNYLNGVSDRFRCFVSTDGIFDNVMSYYSTDELWFMEREFGGTPTESPEVYRMSSPATFVKNFKTPTLVIHGGRDYRLDDSQGFAMYTALKRNGVPAQLLYFPDEPHYFRKTLNWKYVYKCKLEWLAKWLNN